MIAQYGSQIHLFDHRKPDSSPQAPEFQAQAEEYLTKKEIERLQEVACKRSRYRTGTPP